MQTKRGAKRIATKGTIAKRYKMATGIIAELRKLSKVHGSQGRAIQIATEFLIRAKRPVAIPKALLNGHGPYKDMSYKLVRRTADVIDTLADTYGTRNKVLAACVIVLREQVKFPKH